MSMLLTEEQLQSLMPSDNFLAKMSDVRVLKHDIKKTRSLFYEIDFLFSSTNTWVGTTDEYNRPLIFNYKSVADQVCEAIKAKLIAPSPAIP